MTRPPTCNLVDESAPTDLQNLSPALNESGRSWPRLLSWSLSCDGDHHHGDHYDHHMVDCIHRDRIRTFLVGPFSHRSTWYHSYRNSEDRFGSRHTCSCSMTSPKCKRRRISHSASHWQWYPHTSLSSKSVPAATSGCKRSCLSCRWSTSVGEGEKSWGEVVVKTWELRGAGGGGGGDLGGGGALP
ncbi:hypothetical protein Mapa_004801 [Marchantia paleacea]|nr:hypothetical protein Mapa_004801 [Marchantia paleacea]